MLDKLIRTDCGTDDVDYQKSIRKKISKRSQTADDREFTPAEITKTIGELKDKKAPREDGITCKIFKIIYKQFPTFTYTIYSICLQAGCFPKKWKKAKIRPGIKPGKGK